MRISAEAPYDGSVDGTTVSRGYQIIPFVFVNNIEMEVCIELVSEDTKSNWSPR
jgi:hypothetical protein